MAAILRFAAASLLLRTAAADYYKGDCYFIDGSNDLPSRVCNSLELVGASMCCYLGEECHPDGLCTVSAPSDESVGPNDFNQTIWRRSCSDITWQDPACQAIAPWLDSQAAWLTNCSDASLCARSANFLNMTCCDGQKGQRAGQNQAPIAASVVSNIQAQATASLQTTSSYSSGYSSGAPSSSLEVLRTSTVVIPKKSTAASNTKAIGDLSGSDSIALGLSLGLGLPLLLVTAIAFLIIVRKRKVVQKSAESNMTPHTIEALPAPMQKSDEPANPGELSPTSVRRELAHAPARG